MVGSFPAVCWSCFKHYQKIPSCPAFSSRGALTNRIYPVNERKDELTFLKDEKTGEWRIYTETWEPDERGVTPRSLLVNKEHGRNRDGTEELSNILGPKKFKNPKPSKFLKHLFTIGTNSQSKEDIVLDAFAGSGTKGEFKLQVHHVNF